MSLPWFKVHTDLAQHPKLVHLESLLGISDGLGIVIRLWCWAAKYAADGSFPPHMAGAAGREAARGVVPDEEASNRLRNRLRNPSCNHNVTVAALIESGWIDAGEMIWIVHDWAEEQSAHARAIEKNREKQKAHRERNRLRNPVRNQSRNRSVTGRDVDVDRDQDKKGEKAADVRANAPAEKLPPIQTVEVVAGLKPSPAGLEQDPLLVEIRTAFGKGELDPEWINFASRAMRCPAEKRAPAWAEFKRRGEPFTKGKLAYLAGFIEGGAAPPAPKPGAANLRISESLKAETPGRKFI